MYWCKLRYCGDRFWAGTETWNNEITVNSDECESWIKFKKH